MREQLEEVKKEALKKIEASNALEKLNDIRVSYLSKKGELTNPSKSMKDVVSERRPKMGQMVNDAGVVIEGKLEEAGNVLARKTREEQLKREVTGVTLLANENSMGHNYPNIVALEEVERISVGAGYEVVGGPEAEHDRYNFEKLNVLKGHLARDEQSTFYINDTILLRNQTSPVQARIMEKGHLPIRIAAPDRVFHSDEVDTTHSPSFCQIGGLIIDKNITSTDLEGTLAELAGELSKPGTKVKSCPHHFPFMEPGAEVDVTCFKCGGKGCRFCKGSDRIEILGRDMVHPHVLKMCDVDPGEYPGLAFGVSLERIALLKCEINNMHLLYGNNVRFLEQF